MHVSYLKKSYHCGGLYYVVSKSSVLCDARICIVCLQNMWSSKSSSLQRVVLRNEILCFRWFLWVFERVSLGSEVGGGGRGEGEEGREIWTAHFCLHNEVVLKISGVEDRPDRLDSGPNRVLL